MDSETTLLGFVIPVFDDWEAFSRLLQQIDRVLLGKNILAHVIAVDDGSSPLQSIDLPKKSALKCISNIEILHLACNLGHQRAIAVGLSEVFVRKHDFAATVIMDSDGEDKPEDILRFVQTFQENRNRIVVALRSKRSEGQLFRIFYWIYKSVFLLLTGKVINFGNFCLVPRSLLEPLVYTADTWNNLAASIIRSRLPYIGIRTERGTRYAGTSRMSLVNLALHGLSAISVYTDIVFVRLLFGACFSTLLALIGMTVVVFIKFGTTLAIPGWATNLMGMLTIIVFQLLTFSAASTFLVLANRSRPLTIPTIDSSKYIRSRSFN